jgi:hypothetical protein
MGSPKAVNAQDDSAYDFSRTFFRSTESADHYSTPATSRSRRASAGGANKDSPAIFGRRAVRCRSLLPNFDILSDIPGREPQNSIWFTSCCEPELREVPRVNLFNPPSAISLRYL